MSHSVWPYQLLKLFGVEKYPWCLISGPSPGRGNETHRHLVEQSMSWPTFELATSQIRIGYITDMLTYTVNRERKAESARSLFKVSSSSKMRKPTEFVKYSERWTDARKIAVSLRPLPHELCNCHRAVVAAPDPPSKYPFRILARTSYTDSNFRGFPAVPRKMSQKSATLDSITILYNSSHITIRRYKTSAVDTMSLHGQSHLEQGCLTLRYSSADTTEPVQLLHQPGEWPTPVRRGPF